MNAAWYLRSRQLRASLRFWIAITGYDINERSGSSYGYLVYLILFFSVWGLVVLSLFSSAAAGALQLIAPNTPGPAAVRIAAVPLLGWWLWTLFGAARRSPVRFSSEDAALVCLSPASRPSVIFSWSLSDWLLSAVPFWGLAVVLGFALTEIALGGKDIWENLPVFLANGVRFFLPVLLIHGGLFALMWALGCARLQANIDRRGMIFVPVAIGALLAAAVLSGSIPHLPAPPELAPGAYLVLLGVGLVWLLAGIGLLYAAARRVNLARAAQETEFSSSVMAATMLGNTQTAESIQLKQRLGAGSPPIHLPSGSGPAALTWKQGVQALRGRSLKRAFDWLLIFGLFLGALVAPDWGSRSMVILFLSINVHKKTTERLQNDLSYWPLFQPLPLAPAPRLAAELGPGILLVTLLGWGALALVRLAGLANLPPGLAVLVPLLAFILAGAAAYDVIRQAKAEHLLLGQTQAPGVVAVLLSILALAINVFLLTATGAHPAGIALTLAANALLCWGLWNLCTRRFQQLGM